MRDLAKRQLEYANYEENKNNLINWKLHNSFQCDRPMIHLELATFKHEVIPKRLKCHGQEARSIEESLYMNFINLELFGDNRPVPDYYPVRWNIDFRPLGHVIETTHAENTSGNTLGHRFNYIIEDLEDDFHKLGPSTYSIDKAAVLQNLNGLNELFQGILPAKLGMDCLYSVPTQYIVHMMGTETMLISMCDYPELFHKMMLMLTDDTIAFYRWMEAEGLMLATTGLESLGQGSWCFTNKLPSDGTVTSKNVWGFMDSQETVCISPAMFEEMVFPYYKKISEEYGLLSYGCCEGVHPIWENCLSKLPNLRKISISPWCDEEYMGEALKGRRIIFHRKPSPNFLGVGAILDEDGFREHIKKTLKAAQGCTLEITQRDVYTINNDESKARRYIDIIKEEITNVW